VGYADRILGETLRALDAAGLYDDALVVVTADHGDSFSLGVSGRDMDAEQRAAAEIGWVPLFIKAPGQTTARTDMRNWLHVDLLPTLADHAGVTVPWRIDGTSALREERASADKPFHWNFGRPVMLDPGTVAQVLAGPDDVITVPDAPRPDLVGRAVADMPVTSTELSATVTDLERFRTVGQRNKAIPAVVYGTVPDAVAAGETMVIALNGTIAATVPVLPPRKGEPRFGGVIGDADLYRTGANRVELFLLDKDQRTLRQLRL
jgi:Sulfatase